MPRNLTLLIVVVCISMPLLFAISEANAQVRKRPITDPFRKSQWWLGFRAGPNVSSVSPQQRFSSVSPINYSGNGDFKEYKNFADPGFQAGLTFTFFTRGISISSQPSYAVQRYSYLSRNRWTDPENADIYLLIDYDIRDELQLIDVPLVVRYELALAEFRPFVEIGGYYDFLIRANKSITETGEDNASGFAIPFEKEKLEIGAQDQFRQSTYGIVGGIGLAFNAGNVRMVLDASYRYGLVDINNSNNRYSDIRLASLGEVMDDIRMRSIWLNLAIVFPLKYISSSYEAIN